ARRQALVPALADLGEPPHWYAPPTLFGGEEAPVRHRLAEGGVGDVVGAQTERVDGQQRLSLGGLGDPGILEADAVKVVARDQKVHRGGGYTAGASLGGGAQTGLSVAEAAARRTPSKEERQGAIVRCRLRAAMGGRARPGSAGG